MTVRNSKGMKAAAAATSTKAKKICILQYNNVKLAHVTSGYSPEARIIFFIVVEKTTN